MKFITGKPNIINKRVLIERLEDVIESGMWTNNGPQVRRLEEKFEELTGVPAVAVANATLGLEALCRIFPMKDVPSFSFIASASAVKITGTNSPMFYDVDEFYQPKIQSIRKSFGTVLVNLFGGCGNLDEHPKICDNFIYDNAHALGVKWKGESVAKYGLGSVYSLHSTKFVNGIEGGLVSSPNPEVIDRVRSYRNFGYIEPSEDKYKGVIGSVVGTNAKMSELHAATALHNLCYIDFFIESNKERYFWYKEWLPEQCSLIEYDPRVSPNFSYIIVRVNAKIRSALCDYLYNEGIYVKQYFNALHKLPLFDSKQKLVNSELFSTETIALPQGLQLKNENDVLWICTKIRQFFKDNS